MIVSLLHCSIVEKAKSIRDDKTRNKYLNNKENGFLNKATTVAGFGNNRGEKFVKADVSNVLDRVEKNINTFLTSQK